MAIFSPGQFRQSLQNKIKGADAPVKATPVPQIKNTDPNSFAKPASTYAANEMREIQSAVKAPHSTASLPTGSIMNKSVHERMQSFVKSEFGAK